MEAHISTHSASALGLITLPPIQAGTTPMPLIRTYAPFWFKNAIVFQTPWKSVFSYSAL